MTSGVPAVSFDAPDLASTPAQHGLWGQAWRRLLHNRLALAAGLVLIVAIILAVLTSFSRAVERYDPAAVDYSAINQSPSPSHLLGTDNLGRDNWARVWEGMRISLKIGFGAELVALLIGILLGAAAALGGRFSDGLLMRLTDLAYAFPDLLAIILLRAVLTGRDWPIIGTGSPQIFGFSGIILQMIAAIGFVSWVTIARLVRGQMLALAQSDYIVAARSLGATTPRIVCAHMLPNTLGPVIVAVTFGIPLAIFAEAVLGFIGFSLPPPAASLGTLVNDGYAYYRVNMWMLLVPTVALAILMLCFTFLGDGLRDALDPRSRR